MKLSDSVRLFIEDHITLIDEGEFALFFYNAIYRLRSEQCEELVHVMKDIAGIDINNAVKGALMVMCQEFIAIKFRKKVAVSRLLKNLPLFGYDPITFRKLFIDAVTTVYPNKTLIADEDGIEYIVEKN